MKTPDSSAVLITGASAGIGAAYAERFARRGHDLVLVARDQTKLEALAARFSSEHGVRTDVLAADLTQPAALKAVEDRLRSDERIGVLLNNAGAASSSGLANPDPERDEMLIRLNILATTRLTEAVIPRFVARGEGAIINLSSVLAVAPELMAGVYPATKAFVYAFSLSLQSELGPKGVYVQAVLPSATKTEIWERSGASTARIPVMMETAELVDAALVGFDRREAVTVPSLPDFRQWEAYDGSRRAMMPNFRQAHAAPRYRG